MLWWAVWTTISPRDHLSWVHVSLTTDYLPYQVVKSSSIFTLGQPVSNVLELPSYHNLLETHSSHNIHTNWRLFCPDAGNKMSLWMCLLLYLDNDFLRHLRDSWHSTHKPHLCVFQFLYILFIQCQWFRGIQQYGYYITYKNNI